ncbi:RICIN domain-containing protein [Saccharothrix sp. S26]|uniref:glycoside hydrolase family 66 protein n=1 Tax=Saccharothrix sp. S26 TaxID=2907215 RepID=UPI001F1D984C|nr:glycoside hydrolase family 66 protein [Saccharothrix sp. S26]MCE6998393.1 RICIN domain-containing protein [Saccharothrix sp. S26]
MSGARTHHRTRVLLAGATAVLATAASAVMSTTTAHAATVTDAWTDAARYAPGAAATVTASVSGSGPVRFTLTHLGDVVTAATVQASGSGQVTWRVTPPNDDYTGYLVEVEADSGRAQTAIDVSSSWTRFPRMGFLAYYGQGISAAEADGDMAELAQRYHINSLQYYDWLWKHELPVKHDGSGVAATWTAWNGDVISSQTVRNYISSARARGIGSLPYQMSYAALNDYDRSRVDPNWRLLNRDGTDWTYPMLPGQVLKLMNPENPGWQDYIVGQYADTIRSMGFDGSHLDQIGYWDEKFDVNGRQVNRPNGFAQLVEKTKQATGKPVGFNAVDGYGDQEFARSGADYLYTELWSNFETNSSVKNYLENQRRASGGKPHVTPAYMNRPNTPEGTPNNNSVFDTTSVQLANATFAANGAHHLELGPNDHMLNTEYFLNKSKTMSAELKAWQKTYYDVITGYENLFYGPDLHTASNAVQIAGRTTSTDGAGNTIWTNVMRNNGVDVIHLINLLGNDNRWRDAGTNTPPTQTDLPVKYYLGDRPAPPSLHVASPDRDGGRSRELAFTTGSDGGGRYLSFTVPELRTWDFVYFDNTPDDPTTTPPTSTTTTTTTPPPAGSGHLTGLGGKCADVANGSSANGTAVQLWTCADTPAQAWTFTGGKLKALGKCLDVEGGATANGTRAHLWDCLSVASQTWERTGGSQYRNTKSGRCLDVADQSTTDGTRLHLWDCHAGDSQKWSLPQ